MQASAKAAAKLKAIGPKEVFKHTVLTHLLKHMRQRYQNSWTYVDFSPGPGRYVAADGGNSWLYRHAHQQFADKQLNYFQDYIADLMRFNADKDAPLEDATLKRPPAQGSEPHYYPSSAGLASLYLRDIDKAILVEDDPETRAALMMEFEEGLEKGSVEIVGSDSIAVSHQDTLARAKSLVPPINRRGLLTFDLDLKLEQVRQPTRHEHQFADRKSQFFSTHEIFLFEASGLIGALGQRWPEGTFYIPYPMSSHLPFAKLVRNVISSGCNHVLNCSMFLEGDPDEESNPAYARSGIGCLIVNPPAGLDYELHQHLPKLKTEVFMPTILTDEKEPISPTQVQWLLTKDQPWDDVQESAKKQTWEYFRKADLTDDQHAEYEANQKLNSDGDFDEWLNTDQTKDVDEMYAALDKYPDPVKWDINDPIDVKYKIAWERGMKKTSMMTGGAARPTYVKKEVKAEE